MDRTDPAFRGQADYSPLLLGLSDPIVIGVVSRLVWRFPADALVDLYRARISDRHLDVGPGTGYLIDHSGIPDGSHITIVDPNPNVLRHATRRLRRLNVTAVEADVLKPLPVEGPCNSPALSLVLLDDSEDGLRKILAASFESVELQTFRSVVVFSASKPQAGARAGSGLPGPSNRRQAAE